MPKFTYSAAKGIEQSSGSGFIVQDVPISRSVYNDGTVFDTTNSADYSAISEEVLHMNTGGSHTITLDSPDVVGTEKTLLIGTDGGNLTINPGALSVTITAATAVKLIWNGTAWLQLS